MRLMAIALAEGCTKLTLSCAATLKLCQLSDRFWLDWLMVVVAPDCTIPPAPATTCPPCGAATAMPAASDNGRASNRLREPVPRPRAGSATATQHHPTRLQTRRKMRFNLP